MKLTQQGFSLVSVLIAAAIMGLLATNFALYMKNSGDAQKGLETRGEAMALEQMLSLLLSNTTNCQAMFTNAEYSPPGMNDVISIGNANFNISQYPPTNKYGTNLTIKSITLQEPPITSAPNTADNTLTDYVTRLIVRVITSNRELNLEVPLAITSKNSDGKITSCTSAGGGGGGGGSGLMDEALCEGIKGAVWDTATAECITPNNSSEIAVTDCIWTPPINDTIDAICPSNTPFLIGIRDLSGSHRLNCCKAGSGGSGGSPTAAQTSCAAITGATWDSANSKCTTNMTQTICEGILGASWVVDKCITGALTGFMAESLTTIPLGTIIYVP
jgi:hypothetical protein